MGIFPETVQGYTTDTTGTLEPSKTYYLDFDTGDIQGLVDGETAIRQAIHKALVTNMARPLIYDGTYGSELESLIGGNHSIAFLKSEVPRMVREALIYDNRIKDVSDVTVAVSGDVVYVELMVTLKDETKLSIAEAVNI